MKKLIIFFFIVSSSISFAQKDNVLWASFQLQKSITKKTAFNVKPIIRYNDDISSYQNISVDYFVKQKIGKGWSAQLLGRTWFLPSQKNRQFIWLDVAYSKAFKKIKIGNRLRYHWALDINDRSDPDFFRWSTRFEYASKSKFTPYFAIEPWLRTNTQNQFQRIRYEPGVSYKVDKKMSLNLQYRIEKSIHLTPKRTTNFIVFNLLYKI